MIKKLKILILFLFFASCAAPKVVNVIGPNDNKLNCKELSAEIIIANRYANEAQEAKKMSKPHNIASLLFFIPATAMTIWNVDEATTAAKNRALHLNKLKEKKGC